MQVKVKCNIIGKYYYADFIKIYIYAIDIQNDMLYNISNYLFTGSKV